MRFLCILISLFWVTVTHAQREMSPYAKFGKISAEELQKKVYSIDSNANAVVLSDIGETGVEGNSKGWFSINFKRHRVVHILNKNGYSEADVVIQLYADGNNEEKLENVKAVTYNLENGHIVETKLDKSNIFKEKVNKNLVLKKFTLPNVKEGCIIEYEYTVNSDYIQNLDPWVFQGPSPELWSEYTLSVPEFFNYAFLSHGYQPLYINDKKNRQGNFTVADTRSAASSERFNFNAGITDYRWVMKDVPEMKEENFTSALKNHISRIDFQLASQNYPLEPHEYRSTWNQLCRELSESEGFGHNLSTANGWLGDDLKPVLASANDNMAKAKSIYDFVKQNFTCTGNAGIWAENSLKNVMKDRKGSVSEINLLLTAMLRYADIEASPVILSTTSHGYAPEMYPMITNFNYVVSRCEVGDQVYYLDASDSRLGFGKLLPYCYNGHARVVDNNATPVYLQADSLAERKISAIFITNDPKGGWQGFSTQTPGYYESYNIRNKIKEKGKEEFFKDLGKGMGKEFKITDGEIDSLDQYELPVTLHFKFNLKNGNEDLLYVNPLFGEAYKDNPFKSADRYYPVEMPYTSDKTFVLSLEVPEGYEVDELPKQLLAKLDEQGSAQFEYRISQSGSVISLRTRMKINRTLFLPEEYVLLREFFNLIVNKQNELIVFKKKK